MARSVDPRLAGIQGKPLAMRGETGRKDFAADPARFVGQLIVAALRHANLTPQEAAFLLGYADQSALSRWMTGVDVPAFLAKLLQNRRLRKGLVIALAELKGDNVHVKTQIEIDHEAAS